MIGTVAIAKVEPRHVKGVAPGIKIVVVSVARRKFPFLLGRQTISHAVSFRSPRRESDCIVVRNICHRQKLLAHRRFDSAPGLGRRMIALAHKVCVLGVGHLSLVHKKRFDGRRMRGRFGRRPIISTHLKCAARNLDQVRLDDHIGAIGLSGFVRTSWNNAS